MVGRGPRKCHLEKASPAEVIFSILALWKIETDRVHRSALHCALHANFFSVHALVSEIECTMIKGIERGPIPCHETTDAQQHPGRFDKWVQQEVRRDAEHQ